MSTTGWKGGGKERSFDTAQDRLVKEMRVAGVRTLEEANAYLRQEFLPWWNRTLTVAPACGEDAHRRLGREHNLAAILSHVETRQVKSDYTVAVKGRHYVIDRGSITTGLRVARAGGWTASSTGRRPPCGMPFGSPMPPAKGRC